MPPFTDYLKMWVTKPSSNMVPKKWRSDLTEVSQATPNPVKTIAQGTASTAPLWMNSKIQNLANIPKMSVTKSPFNFTNLIGQQQGWLPNTDFLKMWMQWPTQQGMQEFNTRLDDANTSIKDNKRQFVERVAKWWVITRKEIEEQMSGFDDNKKREFLSVLWQSNAKIEWIDFNNEPKEWFTIGNTDISVNPIKQAWEKILEAKEYLKNNPQADPIMKTLLQWIISSFDPTWWLATSWLMQTDAVSDILPKTDNPLTQWVMWFVGNTTRGVWQVIEWGAWLVDKGIAGTQSLVQGWDMSQYQTRQTGIGEDILDVWAGATQSLASIYAMPSSLLIGAGIEALPPEWQKVVSDTMIWLWDIIAKTPWLKQWMESLPPERRDEFKAELAGATVWLRWWLKNKGNIIKDPKLFIKENLNPVQMAKNFNENVIGIPSKALDMAVSTVGKIDLPEVNVPTMKWDKLNKISEWLVASTFKQPAMREKYISKVWQTPEKTLLEAGIKWTLEDQTRQVLELSKQSAKKARSEASKINETFASPEGSWITDKILEWVDTSIPWIQKKLQPILDMNQRFKDWTATTNDLIDAKTFLSRYEQIYDDFGRVKKTWDTFEKEALADMYSTMKTQVEDLWAKYWIDMEKINYDTMKFEWLRWLMTRALSRESNRDIMWLSDYILWGYGATIDPVSTLLVVWWKKLLQSPNVSSRIANLLYKKKWDNFISRIKKDDTSISRATDSDMASKNIQGTVKSPALPERRSVDYLYEWKKPIDLWSNLDKNGNVIKKYTAQDLLQEVRLKKKDNTLDNNISKNEQTLKTTRGVDTKDSWYTDKSTSLTKINESKVVPNRKRRFSAEQVKEQYKEIERLNKQSEMYYDVSQNLWWQEFEDYLYTVTDPTYLKKPLTFDEYKSKLQKYQEQAMQEIRNSDPTIKDREDDVSKVMMLERRDQRTNMVWKNKLSKEEIDKNVRQLEKDKESMRETLAERYGQDWTELYDKAVASITAKTKEPKYTSNFWKTKEEIDIQRQNKRVLKESQKKSANKKLSDSLLNKLNNPKKSVQSDTLVSKYNSDIFNYSEGNYIPIKEWDELLYNTKDLIVDEERMYKQFKWEIKTKKLLDEKVDMVRKYSYMRKRLELDDILDYKELYKELPELKKVDVHIMNDPKLWYSAMWDWNDITLNVSKLKDSKQIKNAILHELQHKIQDIYDLPRWSNTSEVKRLKNLWWNIDEMLWQSDAIRSRGNKTINWEHIPEKLISEFETRLKKLKWNFNTLMKKIDINDRYESTIEWIELKKNIIKETSELFWWIDFLRIYKKVPWEKWARLAWWDEPLFGWDISFAFWKKLNPLKPKDLQPLYEEAKKYKSADEFIRAQDTIYHWSPYKFDEFNTDNVGKSVWSDKEWIFFTNSETLAWRYTYDPSKNIRWWIINATVNIKNPLEIEVKQTPLSYFTSNKEKIIKKAKKWWYDWIKIYDKLWDENIIISLDPNNIKTEAQLRKIREEANFPWNKKR